MQLESQAQGVVAAQRQFEANAVLTQLGEHVGMKACDFREVACPKDDNREAQEGGGLHLDIDGRDVGGWRSFELVEGAFEKPEVAAYQGDVVTHREGEGCWDFPRSEHTQGD